MQQYTVQFRHKVTHTCVVLANWVSCVLVTHELRISQETETQLTSNVIPCECLDDHLAIIVGYTKCLLLLAIEIESSVCIFARHFVVTQALHYCVARDCYLTPKLANESLLHSLGLSLYMDHHLAKKSILYKIFPKQDQNRHN